jgi:hypothetical protein
MDHTNPLHVTTGKHFVIKQFKTSTMAKYGKKAGEKVEKAMHEKKRGELKSGRSGKKVTSRKQAIAIGLSEARAEGGKVPAPKKKSSAKKSSAKKSSGGRKTASKKSSSKKSSGKSKPGPKKGSRKKK